MSPRRRGQNPEIETSEQTRRSRSGLASESPDAPITFEEAMMRLEAIIERIESGEIGLEQSLTEYERGVALVKRCREILDRAEQRVEQLRLDSAAEGSSRRDRPSAAEEDQDVPI